MLGKALRKGKLYMNPVPTSVGGWATFFYVLWAYLTNREERTPKRSPGPFRTDPRVYENPPSSWVAGDVDGALVHAAGDRWAAGAHRSRVGTAGRAV